MNSSISERVAFALCPPPDGYYDDEQTLIRHHIKNGEIFNSVSKAELERIKKEAGELFSNWYSKPWGTYRMLPE